MSKHNEEGMPIFARVRGVKGVMTEVEKLEDVNRGIRAVCSDGVSSVLAVSLRSLSPAFFLRLSVGDVDELNRVCSRGAGSSGLKYSRGEHFQYGALSMMSQVTMKALYSSLHPWLLVHAPLIKRGDAFRAALKYMIAMELSGSTLTTYHIKVIFNVTAIFTQFRRMFTNELIEVSGKRTIQLKEGPKVSRTYRVTDKGKEMIRLAMRELERRENGMKSLMKAG